MKLLNCGREELKASREILELSIVPGLIQYATPAHLDRLASINRAMLDQADKTGDADRFDLEFHMALVDIIGNRDSEDFCSDSHRTVRG